MDAAWTDDGSDATDSRVDEPRKALPCCDRQATVVEWQARLLRRN